MNCVAFKNNSCYLQKKKVKMLWLDISLSSDSIQLQVHIYFVVSQVWHIHLVSCDLHYYEMQQEVILLNWTQLIQHQKLN